MPAQIYMGALSLFLLLSLSHSLHLSHFLTLWSVKQIFKILKLFLKHNFSKQTGLNPWVQYMFIGTYEEMLEHIGTYEEMFIGTLEENQVVRKIQGCCLLVIKMPWQIGTAQKP